MGLHKEANVFPSLIETLLILLLFFLAKCFLRCNVFIELLYYLVEMICCMVFNLMSINLI